MATSAYVRWLCGGWCLLLCAVSLNADAATRKMVSSDKISSRAVVTGGTASGTAESITITGPALEGEYIAAGTKNVPVRGIHGGVSSGYRTIAGGVKSGLKANLPNLLLTGTIAALTAGVGWVMDEGTLVRKIDTGEGQTYKGDITTDAISCSQASSWGVGIYKSYTFWHIIQTTESVPSGYTYYNNCRPLFVMRRAKSAGYDPIKTVTYPLTEADYATIDPWLNKQSAAWLQDLLKDVCEASPSPGACYDSMVTQAKLIGPATVAGSTKTTTSTFTKPDGTTGTRTQTEQGTYNITYGPNYWDFSTTTKTVNYEDGTKTGESTEAETPDVTDEQPADEEDDEVAASPCAGTKCDGPKYEDLYKPKDDTSQKVNDSYISRVKNIPILASVGNFFVVNASGACPTWQTVVSIDLGFYSGSYNLNFEYFCTTTALQIYQWASYVLMLLAAWVGFKWGILD